MSSLIETARPVPVFHPGIDVTPISISSVLPCDHRFLSVFPVFDLPSELFPYILAHLDAQDLKALSLVDRDCRNLALPSLFSTINVRSVESLQRVLCGDVPSAVASAARCLNNEQPVVIQSLLRALQPSVFPNLRTLHCDATAVSTLPSGPHTLDFPSLKLTNMRLLNHPGTTHPFPQDLQTLHLDIGRDDNAPSTSQISASQLIKDALDQSGQTLRQLFITGRPILDDFSYTPIPNASNAPRSFARLRHVVLGESASPTLGLLQALLGPDTRVDSLGLVVAHSSTLDFLRGRGYMTTLREFTLMGFNLSLPFEHFADFLLSNTHLDAFHLSSTLSPVFITTSLMPILHQMTNLTSLRLVFDIPDNDDEEDKLLESIARMTNLRELWLSGGRPELAGNRWILDHPKILRLFQPLSSSLRRLAFSKDTYPTPHTHPLAPRYGDYYSNRILPMSVRVEKYLTEEERKLCQDVDPMFEGARSWKFRMNQKAWERWHKERMGEVVQTYVKGFGKLEWCYLGQLAFTVRGDARKREEGEVHEPDWPSRDAYGELVAKKLSRSIWRPV